MTYVLGIVAEPWERAYAWATLRSCLPGTPRPDRLLVPDFLLPLPFSTDVEVTAVECGRGFIPVDKVTAAIVAAAAAAPLLLVSAGALRSRAQQTTLTSGVRSSFRWSGMPHEIPAFATSLLPPVHEPPARPRHRHRRVNRLDVWTVDTGQRYFQAVDALVGLPPVFGQYGPTAPIFVYNTNAFGIPAGAPQDDYVILGSGLIGLRAVIESRPRRDARIVVYDINPNALTWIEFVLNNSTRCTSLAALVEAFRTAHPTLPVRPVAAHEVDNAQDQERWYGEQRMELAALKSMNVTFVQADVFTDPQPLLRLLRPQRRTLVMYLDLFVPWTIDHDAPWICEFPGLARSFEHAVRSRVGDAVQFIPGEHTPALQISAKSPFVTDREVAPCM